ncbi:phage minor head protein [Phenylobacterium sp. VNQ135]|uniref:phage minor head protein n=1 Tax=Phenylobacterium sp. VNQ135 TaxID=3400922 RepID=UPI003C0D72FA
MPRQPTLERLYEELLTRYGREIADAFVAAVQDMATAADLQQLITAIEAGNLEAAIAALNIEQASYSPVLEAIRSGYVESGNLSASAIRLATIRFDVRNPRAERWLTDHSSTLVREIISDQRVAVRQALTAGMERGENPRTTALNIVGRLNRQTGKRENGILGLTSVQEQYVRNAQAELESGDPAQLRAYLERARRSKVFDRAVRKAVESGEAIPAETVRKAIAAYRGRLLKLRGDMIGRTEALTALRAAQHESYLQAAEAGKIAESAVRKVWRDASDLRVRHTHRVMDGQSVGLRETFVSPSGARLLYPGDPSAPAAERIGCRCVASYLVKFL